MRAWLEVGKRLRSLMHRGEGRQDLHVPALESAPHLELKGSFSVQIVLDWLGVLSNVKGATRDGDRMPSLRIRSNPPTDGVQVLTSCQFVV
jgi:hypothetical protein